MSKKIIDVDMEKDAEVVSSASHAEIAKINIKDIAQQNLFGFFNGVIARANSQNTLFKKVEEEILERVQNAEDKMTTQNLLKLFEIMAQNKTQSEANLLALAKDPMKIEAEKTDIIHDIDGGSAITPEDMSRAKEAVKYIENIKSKLHQHEKSELN